jgi:hypothetical protein
MERDGYEETLVTKVGAKSREYGNLGVSVPKSPKNVPLQSQENLLRGVESWSNTDGNLPSVLSFISYTHGQDHQCFDVAR